MSRRGSHLELAGALMGLALTRIIVIVAPILPLLSNATRVPGARARKIR